MAEKEKLENTLVRIKGEVDELAKKIKEAKMPAEVQETAEKEMKKLKMMSPLSAEANVIRNYLEWLVAMPWEESTKDNFDLKRAQEVLDEDHYGLEKVKERIVEYLAVASLKKSLKYDYFLHLLKFSSFSPFLSFSLNPFSTSDVQIRNS